MLSGRQFAWCSIVAAVIFFVWQFFRTPALPGWGDFLYWAILFAMVDALPVRQGRGTEFTMSFPIALAIAFVFSETPWVPMAIAAVAAFDEREFKGEIPYWRGLFNRAQVMIATGVAALVLGVGSNWRIEDQLFLLIPAALAHIVLNFGQVSLALHFNFKLPLREALFSSLPKPHRVLFFMQVVFVVLGGATALIYLTAPRGEWLVPAILAPILLGRLSLIADAERERLAADVAQKQKALLEATDTVFREREHERTRIAEEIHDTTLQHLAAVSLMTRKALRAVEGREFAIVVDALEAVAASANESLDSLRQSVMDLRRSQLESENLQTAVNEFVRNVQTLWDVPVEVQWELSSSPPVPVALAAFQVIHEAVINALKHSESTSIAVRAEEDNGSILISIEDTGRGFDPANVDATGHLGVGLMRSRAEAVGGELAIESKPNESTRIRLTVPTTG